MRRALFLLQFRRMMIPYGVVCVAVDAFAALIQWFTLRAAPDAPPQDAAIAGDILAGLIGVCLTIPIGASAFSRDFKEKHYLFFHSLPLSLREIWAMNVAANFTVMWCCVVLMSVFRPSLAAAVVNAKNPSGGALPVVIVAATLCVAFAVGNCFALCFRRDLLSYLVPIFVASWTVMGILGLAALCSSEPGDRAVSLHMWCALCGLGAAIVTLLALSLRFFLRGEITLLRVQVRNTTLTIASLVSVIVAFAAAVSLGVFARLSPWVPSGLAAVSADGKYVLVTEMRKHHPQFSRASILDTQAGTVLQRAEFTGLAGGDWFGHVALAPLSDDFPLRRLMYLLPQSDQIARLFPDKRDIGVTRLPASTIIWWPGLWRPAISARAGRLMVIYSQGGEYRIAAFDPASGQLDNLLGGEAGAHFNMQSERDGTLLTLESPLSARQAGNHNAKAAIWLIGDSEKQIPWAEPASEAQPDCVIDGAAYAHMPDCGRRLTKLFPPPPGTSGAYVLDRGGRVNEITYISETTPIYYLRPGASGNVATLLAWSRAKDSMSRSSWITIADNLPLGPAGKSSFSDGYVRLSYNPRLSPAAGIAVYFTAAQKTYLYDGIRNRTVELGSLPDPNPLISIGYAAEAVVVNISRSGTQDLLMTFRYDPISGQITRLRVGPSSDGTALLFADEAGNEIIEKYQEHRGVYRRTADGTEAKLWPR